jgi:hypothetical protein
MERSNRGLRILPVLALIVMIASLSGCASFISAGAWIVKGHNVKPEYAGLKGKKVAVVCRPLAQLEYSAGNASTELARVVGMLLDKRVNRVKVIESDRVAEWTDEHNWEEFTEIGEALNADMVLGIDMREFGLYQGMTLYQGHANVSVAVYDMRDGGKIVYQKSLPRSVYPPNTGIPTSERTDDEFRRQYIGILADEIGRHFYEHDAMANFAQDTDALR